MRSRTRKRWPGLCIESEEVDAATAVADHGYIGIREMMDRMTMLIQDTTPGPRPDDPGGSVELLRILMQLPAQAEQGMRGLSDLAAQVCGVERDDQGALLVSYVA
jgi:hypothetical protein